MVNTGLGRACRWYSLCGSVDQFLSSDKLPALDCLIPGTFFSPTRGVFPRTLPSHVAQAGLNPHSWCARVPLAAQPRSVLPRPVI